MLSTQYGDPVVFISEPPYDICESQYVFVEINGTCEGMTLLILVVLAGIRFLWTG